MNRPNESSDGARAATRGRFAAITSQSERTVMLGTILLASTFSAAIGYLLIESLSVDLLSSMLSVPEDCWLNWNMNVGRHCFSDYGPVVTAGLQPNPWEYETSMPWGNYQPVKFTGPGAAMLPHLLFGFPAHLLGVPRLGLLCYLFALTIAVLTPAIWAARGAQGLERVVVFVALGAAAIPVWAVIDRGNSDGFAVPIALVFLVALRRERWLLAAGMVVLAALIKPWFIVLVIALFAARQWKAGGLTLVGALVTNLAAYLLWPRDFPGTIPLSIKNLAGAASTPQALIDMRNVSFGRALLLIPDTLMSLQTGKIPDGFLAGPRPYLGYGVLVVVVVAVVLIGRRIPPVMAGVVMLATATLFPPITYYYYLAFVLPIAAIIVRSPGGPPGIGIFEQFVSDGDRRRHFVGLSVSLAVAFTIVQIALPTPPVRVPIFGQLGVQGIVGTTPIVMTTSIFTPFLWMIACAVILVSYARRPVQKPGNDGAPPREDVPDVAVSTSSHT